VSDATEAVALPRGHTHAQDRRVRRLAGALHELGRATGDPDPAAEAVDLLREAAAAGEPDAAHDLAAALHGLAQNLDELGLH
jgi:hypothetical protein